MPYVYNNKFSPTIIFHWNLMCLLSGLWQL